MPLLQRPEILAGKIGDGRKDEGGAQKCPGQISGAALHRRPVCRCRGGLCVEIPKHRCFPRISAVLEEPSFSWWSAKSALLDGYLRCLTVHVEKLNCSCLEPCHAINCRLRVLSLKFLLGSLIIHPVFSILLEVDIEVVKNLCSNNCLSKECGQ